MKDLQRRVNVKTVWSQWESSVCVFSHVYTFPSSSYSLFILYRQCCMTERFASNSVLGHCQWSPSVCVCVGWGCCSMAVAILPTGFNRNMLNLTLCVSPLVLQMLTLQNSHNNNDRLVLSALQRFRSHFNLWNIKN